MTNDAYIREQIETELRRLGLSIEMLPGEGLVTDADAAGYFLDHLRSLEPGVTWHDVLPDLPRHWVAGRPETWTTLYRPLGPYDYQELPTGPAVHVSWRSGDGSLLEGLLGAARAAGFAVYGAGLIASPSENWNSYDAMLVLPRGTDDNQLWAFVAWLEAQQGFEMAGVPRLGDEEYTPPS